MPTELPRRAPGGGGYQIVADPAVFATTAAAFLARKLALLAEHGGSLALSGGSTPGAVYEALAGDPLLDWSRIEVFFADERVVPVDDPDSNYRLAREALLDRVEIPAERVHPMPAEASDLGAAARAYGGLLPERLDLLILGVGSDGHTASLFPESAALESDELVVPTTAPMEPSSRLSITPRVIAAARLIVVLAHGASKTDALRAALADTGSIRQCPARLARGGIWIIGRDAVAGLQLEDG